MTEQTKMEIKLRSFDSKILYMNGMYKLPIAPYPSSSFLKNADGSLEMGSERLTKFKDVLEEECKEIEEVIEGFKYNTTLEDMEVMSQLADLLGDIVVFCYSEAAKFGIPMKEVLDIIMASNFSKLGTDGLPIYDERGKFQKGPFYWKPEEKIKALLLERINEAKV